MRSSWIFKPKYSPDIYNKVINCFVDDFLHWAGIGVGWGAETLKDGWMELTAYFDEPSGSEYYSEMCFMEEPLTGEQLTEHMMVLLVEANVAYKYADGADGDEDYVLEDVDISQVLAALAEDDTHIYAPMGSKCWVLPVSTGHPKTVDMLDALLTLQAA